VSEEGEEEEIPWTPPPVWVPGDLLDYRRLNIISQDLRWLYDKVQSLINDVKVIKERIGIEEGGGEG